MVALTDRCRQGIHLSQAPRTPRPLRLPTFFTFKRPGLELKPSQSSALSALRQIEASKAYTFHRQLRFHSLSGSPPSSLPSSPASSSREAATRQRWSMQRQVRHTSSTGNSNSTPSLASRRLRFQAAQFRIQAPATNASAATILTGAIKAYTFHEHLESHALSGSPPSLLSSSLASTSSSREAPPCRRWSMQRQERHTPPTRSSNSTSSLTPRYPCFHAAASDASSPETSRQL